MKYPPYLEADFDFPEFYHIKQRFPRPKLNDIEGTLNSILDSHCQKAGIQKGESIGVGVGSRGIRNLDRIVIHTCKKLSAMGFKPVLIPAMGSHGGATPQGQAKVLETLGITPENCSCELDTDMETIQLGEVFGEVPVYFSEKVNQLDHSICINRVKPHTKFKGDVESGVLKMLCIGLAKHQGALTYHRWALKYGFYELLQSISTAIIEKSNFRFGVGIVENAFDETMRIEGISAKNLLDEEKKLLELAKANMPSLPVKNADALIIKQIGKDISGAGMDPNITGRAADLMEDDFSGIFKATRVAILNLSEKSKGNGLGIGNADFITEKVFQSLDYEVTMMNVLTGMSIKKISIPLRLINDYKAIQACFTTVGPIPPDELRAIVIKDTLNISECLVSAPIYNEISAREDIELVEKLKLPFNSDGNLNLW